MSLQLLAVLILLIVIFVASFFFNVTALISAANSFFEFGWNLATVILVAIVGAVFYFLIRVAGILESQKEIKDFLFYEIKDALEESRISFIESGLISKINALLKFVDQNGESYYIIVNDDFRTLHQVTPSGLTVDITRYSMRFLQDNFVDEQDLVNYINTRTRHRVTKCEPIFDTLPA